MISTIHPSEVRNYTIETWGINKSSPTGNPSNTIPKSQRADRTWEYMGEDRYGDSAGCMECLGPMCGNDMKWWCSPVHPSFFGSDPFSPHHSGRMRLSSWRRIVGRTTWFWKRYEGDLLLWQWMIKWQMLKIWSALQNHWCINCTHLLEKHSNYMIKKTLPEHARTHPS